jgi:hypothetical protein
MPLRDVNTLYFDNDSVPLFNYRYFIKSNALVVEFNGNRAFTRVRKQNYTMSILVIFNNLKES